MKVSSKNKIHRTQLSLKSSMGFRKLHSGFLEFTKIHPVRTIPLAFKCSIPESLLMHSCIQTSQFRLIHKKRVQRFAAHHKKFPCPPDISNFFSKLQVYVQISMITAKPFPKEYHLTASTNIIAMYCPYTSQLLR